MCLLIMTRAVPLLPPIEGGFWEYATTVKRCLPAQPELVVEVEADEQSTADRKSAAARNAANKNLFIARPLVSVTPVLASNRVISGAGA